MKFSILVEILFDLLAKRKLTASSLAMKYGLSVRTIYRYVDSLSIAVPVYVKQGRDGGIFISDSYKLPVGFMTKAEYEATLEALALAYSQLPEERFLDAKRKISAQIKSETRDLALLGEVGTILVDGGTWGDTRVFSDKLQFFESCVKERAVVEIEYHARTGANSKRKIDPHVLVFKQGVWYTYAFCHSQRAFRLFRLGRIVATYKTDEKFTRRNFERSDIPLNYWTQDTPSVDAVFAVDKEAFADAQDWLGTENLKNRNGRWYAEVTLPDDEGLVRKILSLGAGVKVLAPLELKEKVATAAEKIAAAYRE